MISPNEQNTSIKIPALLLVTVQLALALFVIVRFGLEPSAQTGAVLYLLLPLVVVHALSPMPLRRPLVLLATVLLTHFLLGCSCYNMT